MADDMDWLDLDWLEETPDLSVPPRTPASRKARRQELEREEGTAPRVSRQEQTGGQRPAPSARQERPQSTAQRPPQQGQRRQQPPQQQGQYRQQPAPQQGQYRQRPPQQQQAQRRQQPAQPQGQYRQRPPQQQGQRRQQPAPQQGQYRQRPPQQQQGQRRQQPAQPQGQYRQRPPQQQYRQSAEPWREKPSRGGRQVAVEPDDYRPRKKRGISKQSIPLLIVVVLLVGGVLFAGFKLGSALLNYHRDRSAYNTLADEALSGLAEPNATHDPNEFQQTEETEPVQSEAPFAVNWEYLRSVNNEVVGWLYCEGTAINYPVVQTGDNDYYLHRDFTTRQPNTAGTLFADPNAALGVTYSNYIIYGHNMKDGSMFAAIEDYVDQSFYDQHPSMYFLTPDQNYRIDLIAGRIVESTIDNYPPYFSDADYGSYLNSITSHSFFGTRANVTTSCQLITLSTCDYSGGYNDPRFLLQGMLVPIT